MTQVYRDPNGVATGLRVLAVGAGHYPQAQQPANGVPVLRDLTSVPRSIWDFLHRLLGPWRPDLAPSLLSVDLLLSDPAEPGGSRWPTLGLPGEVAPGTLIDPPTIANIDLAVQQVLAGATPGDGLLFLFCGHGFSRENRFFLASDFGTGGAPWNKAVDLDQLEKGLSQTPPRTQWLFWDCCADIPLEILDPLGPIGTTLIQPQASQISATSKAHGNLSRFGASSALTGEQAFGIPGSRSRFVEMLIEAIDGVAATRRYAEQWWVSDQGIMDAFRTYARRHPERADADFFAYITPFSSDAVNRMRLRRLLEPPQSTLVAIAKPMRTALKAARVTVTPDHPVGSSPVFSQEPPAERATLCVRIPAHQNYTVIAVLAEGHAPQVRSCFADLPLADELEFEAPWPS